MYGGKIQLICGPMFAGKTNELLRRIKKYKVKVNCLLIKFEKDKRYSKDDVVTHDKVTIKGVVTLTVAKLMDIKDKKIIIKSVVIGIDEGQFYPDIIDFCELMANQGRIVIVAALDANYKREPFGDICKLMSKAEDVTKLKAVCHFCDKIKEAAFTLRITEDLKEEVIGGGEMYKPCCRSCYIKQSCIKKKKGGN
jgi:thymidine kinase